MTKPRGRNGGRKKKYNKETKMLQIIVLVDEHENIKQVVQTYLKDYERGPKNT